MGQLSTREFAEAMGCTLKHVNAKMKALDIKGIKAESDRRVTLLSEEEQELLKPYVVKNLKPPSVEPVAEFADVELVEESEIDNIQNVSLSFYIPEEQGIEAIKTDSLNLSSVTQSNLAAFRNAQLEAIKRMGRRDAAIAVQAYQAEFQAAINADLQALHGTPEAKPRATSKTSKKQVGQS